MKSLLLLSLAALLFTSCADEPKEADIITDEIQAEIPEEDTFPYDTLQGMYMGDFGGSQIRVVLNYVSGTNAIGYNIHRGLQRNIMGKVKRSGDSVTVTLAEPGDHEFDGVFVLNFRGIDIEPEGVWTANSTKIGKKDFSLKKINFDTKINPSEAITVTNFTNVFDYVTDTIGEYHFEPDGMVILKYYDDDKDWDKQQYKQLKGSWELNGVMVTILWQPNTIFDNNRLDLWIKRSEYHEPFLETADGRELWMMYW